MSNSNNSSAVLVAGATGFLGSEICRQLRLNNKEVRGLVRTTSDANKVAYLIGLGVEAGVVYGSEIDMNKVPEGFPLQLT
jgi:uncharacterized protein YbjT (DUF2867 family)